jgi:hypothetical protein
MVIDSNVITTCMSPFSKHILSFNYRPDVFTLTNMFFCKCSFLIHFTFKTTMVKVIKLSNKSQWKYAQLRSSMVLFTIWSKVSYILIEHLCFKCNIFNSKSNSSTSTTNLPFFIVQIINIMQNKEIKTHHNRFENKLC